METKYVKNLYDDNRIKNVVVMPHPEYEGDWAVQISQSNGLDEMIYVVRTTETKRYRTMDGVMADLSKFGVDKAEFILK